MLPTRCETRSATSSHVAALPIGSSLELRKTGFCDIERTARAVNVLLPFIDPRRQPDAAYNSVTFELSSRPTQWNTFIARCLSAVVQLLSALGSGMGPKRRSHAFQITVMRLSVSSPRSWLCASAPIGESRTRAAMIGIALFGLYRAIRYSPWHNPWGEVLPEATLIFTKF